MTAAIELRGVRFTYPDGREALRGVDLAVAPGERVALLGPNGAGKTTLALHLNGIHRPTEGTIAVGGTPLDDRSLAEIRRRVALVFQDADDQLFMPTVQEDVAFGPANLGLRGDELGERVRWALSAVGMEGAVDHAPHHLSAGERRRVAIATVLAMEPEVMVLDEPSSGLDPAGRRQLIDLLGGLAVTELVITHDLPMALELCPRAAVVNGGVIAADGPTADLLSDEELMRANDLELPFGFDPRALGAARPATAPDAPS